MQSLGQMLRIFGPVQQAAIGRGQHFRKGAVLGLHNGHASGQGLEHEQPLRLMVCGRHREHVERGQEVELAAAIDSMVRNPHGSARRGALVDPTHHQRLDAENDRAMASEFRQQEEGIVPLQGFVARPEKVEGDAQYARPYVTEQRIDRQLPMYTDVTLDRYQMLVDQLSALPGKKVIVPPSSIQGIDWLSRTVRVDLTREAIKSGPEFHEGGTVTSEYTDRLEAHYGRFRGTAAKPAGRKSSRRK